MRTVDKQTEVLIAEYIPSHGSEYPVNVKQLLKDVMRDCVRSPLPKDDDPTVTNYWYKYVKPLLARVGIIAEETPGDKVRLLRGYHNQIVAGMVKDGEITYRDLNIIDRSRQSMEATTEANNPDIICFVEKDAAYSVVKKLHEVYGVTVLEGHGMPSLAKVENILDHLRDICYGKDLTVITFTDFNPAGWNIATAFANQVRNMWAWGVKHYHAGLYLEQFNGRDVSNLVEPIKGPDKQKINWVEWLQDAGREAYIVDGVAKGIELDALGSSEIYNCINGYILQNYDLAKLLNALEIKYQQAVISSAIDTIADDRSEHINNEIARLEQARDSIYEDVQREVNEALAADYFPFSFYLTEEELLEHYRRSRSRFVVEVHLFSEMEDDIGRLLEIV